MNPILIYFITIILFMCVDAPFLYLNADMYKKTTLSISKDKDYTKRYYSAVIVYLALSLGLIVLALPRIRKSSNTPLKERILDSLLYGGVYGLTTYATFDFTMHFMFDKWDLGVSIMDSIWGGVLCSIVLFIISYL
jgi:uncharacterized membrane protein